MTHTRPQSDIVLDPGQFATLRDLLARYSGVFLDETRQRALTGSIARRLLETGQGQAEYIRRLMQPEAHTELQKLAELILNHETIFFRNQPHMQALHRVVWHEISRRKAPGEAIRIWSAGCATGEEPYSLAISALETLGEPLPRPVIIHATDLSTTALNRARAGVYNGRTLNNIDAARRARFFERHSEGYAVAAPVRNLVQFEQSNLLDPFPAWTRGVDAIFCQNVTIYFQIDTCRELMGRFYAALPTDGLLFLGFSETLWNIFDRFVSREIQGAFVYTKPAHEQSAARRKPAPSPAAPAAAALPRNPLKSHRPAESRPRASGLRRPVAARNAQPFEGPIERGRALIEAGRYDEALQALYALPLNQPAAPMALALAARAHANRGDTELAIAEARRSLELDSLTIDAYVLLGMLYAQASPAPSPTCPYLSNAVRQLERARYLDPELPLVSYHLADVLRRQGRSDAALREYRNTLRKLAEYPADQLLDGVAVSWIRETCQRQIEHLDQAGTRRMGGRI
jgi:chemotaxis protein methyltransferase CheR